MLTEDALATQAVMETRGVVATYEGRPINALYSSTCGGRTEDAEHIFNEKVPYLVSVSCESKHPEMAFATSRAIPNWKDGVLAVAGVKSFSDAARFMGLAGRAEPASTNAATLAAFIRQTFYPSVLTASDLSFVREQGILTAGEVVPRKELLFRLIDKKSAFEWQQGVLESFDAGERRMRLLVGGQLKEFSLAPNALVYHRVGDSRLPVRKGSWIGGELVDFRAEGDVIPMLIYRINFANPAADRYSRLALWQVHKTKAELDAAFRSLAIGEFSDMRVIQARRLRASRQYRDHRHHRTRHRPARCACARCSHCATACSRTTSSATRPVRSSARPSSAAAGVTVSACARWAPTAWRWRGRRMRRS